MGFTTTTNEYYQPYSTAMWKDTLLTPAKHGDKHLQEIHFKITRNEFPRY